MEKTDIKVTYVTVFHTSEGIADYRNRMDCSVGVDHIIYDLSPSADNCEKNQPDQADLRVAAYAQAVNELKSIGHYFKYDRASLSTLYNQALQEVKDGFICFTNEDVFYQPGSSSVVRMMAAQFPEELIYSLRFQRMQNDIQPENPNEAAAQLLELDSAKELFFFPHACYFKIPMAKQVIFHEVCEEETALDYLLRTCLIHPRMVLAKGFHCNYTKALSRRSDSHYGCHNKEWYLSSVKNIYQPLASESKQKYGTVPCWLQREIFYQLYYKCYANINLKNKFLLDKEETLTFFRELSPVLKSINDDTIMSNAGFQQFSPPFAIRDFFMYLKYDGDLERLKRTFSFQDGKLVYTQAGIDYDLSAHQNVRIMALNIREQKLCIDFSWFAHQLYEYDPSAIYVKLGKKRVETQKTDYYAHDKIFGESVKKQYTFYAELELADALTDKKDIRIVMELNGDAHDLPIEFYRAPSKLNTVCENSYVSYRFNGKETESSSPHIGLPAGTYRIQIKPNWHKDVEYHFEIRYTASNLWEQEWNNTSDKATKIQVNQEISGVLMADSDVDYYEFTLAKPGAVQIVFKRELLNASGDYWKVTLLDSNDAEYINYYFNGKETESSSTHIGLPAGTYRIQIKPYWHKDVEYHFEVRYTASDLWEKERNDTMSAASEIPLNKTISGSSLKNYDKDFYQFKLTKAGYVTLTFNQTAGSSTSTSWSVSILDANENTFYGMSIPGNEAKRATPSIGLPAGTYYIKMEDSAQAGREYNFQLVYKEHTGWESEWNDTASTADTLSENVWMYGALAKSGDVDYYVFKAPAKADYTLTFSHADLGTSTAYWNVDILNGSETKLQQYSYKGNEKTVNQVVTLEKGTYYIKVKDNWYKSDINYQLKIYRPNPTTVQTVKMTEKGVQITWKAASGATGYNVYRKVAGTTAWKKLGSTKSTVYTFTDSTEVLRNTYYYSVRRTQDGAPIGDDGKQLTISQFKDVLKTSDYFYKPVYWAVGKGITNGYDGNIFGPKRNCTRGDMLTFLWRFAGKPEPKSTVNPFSDVANNKYYYKAILWAVEKGITKGYSDGTFKPDGTCQREHAVTFLYRLAGQPAPKTTKNPFTDIKTSDYYYRATLWAAENNITKGYADDNYKTFRPKNDCLREHIVTFLYRYNNL